MSVTIVVGGQKGGEGKAKLVAYLALADQPVMAARVRGEVEHSFEWGGQRHTLCRLSSAFVNPDTRLLLGPGETLEIEPLFAEIDRLGVADRVGIDLRCSVPSRETLAGGLSELQRFLTDVPLELNIAARQNQSILLEGPYGFAVSRLHNVGSDTVTMDTTAQACCVEVGLGPTHVTDVVVVFSATSGRELKPTVTNDDPLATTPRIVDFDLEQAKRALLVNGATAIALSSLDRRFQRAHGAQRRNHLPNEARQFIDQLEEALGLPVALVSTGAAIEHLIDLR